MRTLAEYRTYLEPLLHLLAKRASFRCKPSLPEIFREHTRLVALFNHGSPLSWIPVACLMAQECDLAGGGDRTPMGVMDNFFYQVPFLKPVAKYISQSERPLQFDELVQHFESRERTDLVVFPEGSNCFFGDPSDVQDFRSPRVVEIAIRTGAPLLIGVHRGSEDWAKAVPVGEETIEQVSFLPDFLKDRLSRTGILAIPLLPQKMEEFSLSCELYKPNLTAADLSADATERRAQISMEADAIRAKMVALLKDLERK